jgi:Fe-S oxidoreductase
MAGWEVELVGDVCCGRSLISKGLLREARERHAALIDRLAPAAAAGTPITGVEPSCVFALRDELVSLSHGDVRAAAIAAQARLVDDMLIEAIDDGTLSLADSPGIQGRTMLFHSHCHQKAAGATAGSVALLSRIPGANLRVLDAGCCGMAGSFGFEKEHYELSQQIGRMRLFPAIEAAGEGAIVVATGASCRQQVAHLTRPLHPVTLVREIASSPRQRA